jgi:hypothetical protein
MGSTLDRYDCHRADHLQRVAGEAGYGSENYGSSTHDSYFELPSVFRDKSHLGLNGLGPLQVWDQGHGQTG